MGWVGGYYRKDGTYVQGHSRRGANEGDGGEGLILLVVLAVLVLPAMGVGWLVAKKWGRTAGRLSGLATAQWCVLLVLTQMTTPSCPDALPDGTFPPCVDVKDGLAPHGFAFLTALVLTACAIVAVLVHQRQYRPPLPAHVQPPSQPWAPGPRTFISPPLAQYRPAPFADGGMPRLHTNCLDCGRPLSDYDSMVRGYGPTCWNRI